MSKPEIESFVQRAEELYSNRLRTALERDHYDEYVAIEPESGDYFLGKTMSEATRAARRSYPDRWTHVMRIGHNAALHFGIHMR